MSDSELSEASHTPVPPDEELAQSLRREVARASKAGDDFTLRQIRTASEKRLGLPEGFYKNHVSWKDKSKDIVQDQIDNETDVPSSPTETKKSSGPAKKPIPQPAKQESQQADGRSRKRQKTQSEDSSEELSSPLSEVDSASEPEMKPKKIKKPQKPPKGKAGPSKKSAKPKAQVGGLKANGGDDGAAGEKSESELSSLIDEDPKPKKKGKGKDSQDGRKKSKGTKSKPQADEDPDQAEIRRLQGWLVKCGIRKVWGKELKPYETPRAKIQYLRQLLANAGMTGRYSIDKANQIREARELAADIEAVKEGDQRWGTGEGEADGDGERPQRRLVRGAKNYDFLSSDGEETD